MQFRWIGRIAGAVALAVALAGCVDVTMDVKVKNEAEAEGTMTQTISAQFYPMLKASKASDESSGDFCSREDGGTLVENADGSATCTIAKAGKFADLGFDDDKEKLSFTSAGPGLVRVAFPTDEFQQGIDAAASAGQAADDEDAQSKAAEAQMKTAMTAYFAGHFLTLKIEGGEITESNMTIAPDKRSAEEKIPFTDIIGGTAKLPKELYAVVKVN